MNNQEFIASHRNDDVRMLALRGTSEGVDMAFCLQQIEGWQLAARKLPRWAQTEGILFPPRLSMEQCSSEQTALYKRSVVERLLPVGRQRMIDLTGGFGIDFSYLAPLFSEATYVERQDALCRLARHNLPLLGVRHAAVVCALGEEMLQERCSLLYVDPARRDDVGRKVVALRDCSPDVVRLHDTLVGQADVVMLKLSPMLDIHLATSELPSVREVHVVSVDGECKELLLICVGERGVLASAALTYHCVNISSKPEVFVTTEAHEPPAISQAIGQYLYEPNASILKAGVQDALCKALGVGKLHPFSHLFTSDEWLPDFPGRRFRVEGCGDFSKRSLKVLLDGLVKANLSVRNFPQTVAELRRRLKLREGGDVYLFATTLADGRHALIKCSKV